MQGENPAIYNDPTWIRYLLLSLGLLFFGSVLVLPLVAVLVNAFGAGVSNYLKVLADPDVIASVRLTLLVSVIVVPLNLLFGIAAAWLITRFRFKGRGLLMTLIDAPLAVSPVIAGLIFVLLFGIHGPFGAVLTSLKINVIFAVPGMVLATLFVTLPFIARELIPLMQEQGASEEEAALTLGASGVRMFLAVTLPNIAWALLYGIILCNARAMGEFGAVSVISGHIRGETHTMPLEVEVLYNEYQFTAAFALASLLVILALTTIALKALLEWRHISRSSS